MTNDYLNNFENMMSNIYFGSFKIIAIILVALLIFSLIMLMIGCLIKSQKIKSKFLIVVPSLIIGNILFITLYLGTIKKYNLKYSVSFTKALQKS